MRSDMHLFLLLFEMKLLISGNVDAYIFFGILLSSIKYVPGTFFSEDLKFGVFVGDFDIATLSGSIKKMSEKMMFSVVINIEQLNSFVKTIPKSKTIIITSEGSFLADPFFIQVRIK